MPVRAGKKSGRYDTRDTATVPICSSFAILPRQIPGETTLKTHDRPLPGRGTSVRQDWCAWMPDEKFGLFDSLTQQLEAAYTMLSVSLNEALEMHRSGRLAKAYQAVCVTPALCARLAEPLGALLRALAEHAKHYGTIPNAAPLAAANFQSPLGQRSARINGLLSRVLLSHRAQFLHKVSTLHELVADLSREFSEAASALSEGPVMPPDRLWQTLDAAHFDLNTCLRETVVLLKSFLVAVPLAQLAGFDKTYHTQLPARPRRDENRARILSHRRAAHIGAE